MRTSKSKEMSSLESSGSFGKLFQSRNRIIYCIIFLAFFVFLYLPTLKWMYGRFVADDTYYSHGFLIPFVSMYLIWLKRDSLFTISSSYSWWGGILILLSLIIQLFSQIIYIFAMSGLSILIFIFGTSLFVFGYTKTKEIIFPISYIVFMLPLPMKIIEIISSPMKMFVAEKGSELANIFGVTTNQNGYYIETVKGTLLIDNPCSGLRSLIAMMALGAIISYVCKTSPNRKIILFLLTIPIALFVNLLRVLLLICVTAKYGNNLSSPGGWVHDSSGYLIFFFGSVILLGFGRAFEWKTLKSG